MSEERKLAAMASHGSASAMVATMDEVFSHSENSGSSKGKINILLVIIMVEKGVLVAAPAESVVVATVPTARRPQL